MINNYLDTAKLAHEKTGTWLRMRNLQREIVSLLIVAQHNAIRTNYIKAKIDNKRQNSKCRRCEERDETVNYIKSECGKLAKK